MHITDESWNKKNLLGVYDLRNLDSIIVYQIIPEEKNKLLDVPDMSLKWDDKNPIWRWLENKWTYPIQKIPASQDLPTLYKKSNN